MDERGKRRNRQQSSGHRNRPAPRKLPPEATGEEDTFMQELVDTGAEVTIKLRNGNSMQGRIMKYEQDLIWLSDNDGLEITLRKNEIRSLHPTELKG